MPHVHAGSVPADHDASPHVHLSRDASDADEHSQSQGGHVHRHYASTASCDGSPLNKPLIGAVEDHDADAVYLPAGLASLAVDGPHQAKVQARALDTHLAHAGAQNLGQVSQTIGVSLRSAEQSPLCAFCLTLRALRI